jgi:hypothetical protein
VTTTGQLDRLLALLAAEADGPTARATAGRPIALGWATVELDRAAFELGAELGVPAERFRGAVESSALGARCRVAGDALSSGVSVVLLEPATEGRLAATLARSGEGPAATWLAVGDLPAVIAALRLTGVEASMERAGPFGAERLVLDGPIHGPHRLLVQLPTGTINA